MFAKIAAYEKQFGFTIKRNMSVVEAADKGIPYAAITPERIKEATDKYWKFQYPAILSNWELPAGAFGESNGPI